MQQVLSSLGNEKNAQRAGLHRMTAEEMGKCYIGVKKKGGERIGDSYRLCLPDRLLARALALVLQGSVLARLGLRETNSGKRDQRRAFAMDPTTPI